VEHDKASPNGGPHGRGTRTARAWAALAGGMVLLAAALVFILQNLRSVDVNFVTLNWRVPLGIDLLLAAVLGGLIVFAAGSLRILQLRRVLQRHERLHEERDHPGSIPPG
jgi:uncharacterized integral membrane protein